MDDVAQNTRSACVFCRRTDRKLSKEHVWPRWLRRHIELAEGPPIGHSRLHASSSGETLGEKAWRAMPLDWQVKAPCRACNEGWMERVEAATSPLVIPMLADQSVVLDADNQATLARWATLRVLMAQHGHPPNRQAIPAATYHRFYRSRELPIGAQVWVGRYSGTGAWPTAYHHVELFASGPDRPEPGQPNAYAAAFSVGYLAFLYWGHEIHDGPAVDLAGLTTYFIPIWPTTAPAEWPPPGLIGARGLEGALRRLPIEY